MTMCIENIDIGGPALIRAAAKNHDFVTVLTEPDQYQPVLDEIAQHGGTTLALRRRLAGEAYARTAAYDAAIAAWFAERRGEAFPRRLAIAGTLRQTLRYGENPHQAAAFYVNGARPGVATAMQVQGKELSYNNLNDTDAAFECVAEFDAPTVAIIKHANPCGVASAGYAGRGLGHGAALRSGLGVRRHRRGEPHARRGGGGKDRGNLHRGDHRTGCRRGGEGAAGAQEEPAPAADRRPARSVRIRVGVPQRGRRISGADARQRPGCAARSEGGDEARADRGGTCRSAVRLHASAST